MDLQLNGGQGRAQFVSGIGNEFPLPIQRLPEPLQQRVQGIHHGLNFIGNPGRFKRVERERTPRIEVMGELLHGLQGFQNAEPNQ